MHGRCFLKLVHNGWWYEIVADLRAMQYQPRQTLNEAKMINKPQKPPCFIPRVVCWRTFTHERSNVAIKIKNAKGGLFI